MTREVRTYCRICEPACGLVAQVDGERVRLSPDRDHPVHAGFCCHKGLSFHQVHEDPDRLDFPLRRCNPKREGEGRFDRVTWDEAMAEIGERLRGIRARHGPGAVAIYYGNPVAFDSRAFPALAALAANLGIDKMFSGATQDCSNKMACNEQVYGTGFMHPIPDLEHTDYLLTLGSNPRVSHMSFVHTTDPMALIKGIAARGGKVRFVNPRRIESSTPATGDVLLIKPDADVYFLAAVLHEIHTTSGFDDAFLERHAKNVDGLVAFIASYPPERVEGVTGISASDIRSVAREFCEAAAASVYMSTGVNQGRQGTLSYWLVQMLSAVTGNLGRRGGNLYSAGFFPTAARGAIGAGSPMFDGPLGRVRHCVGVLPGALFADYLDQHREPIRALLVLSGNPLLTIGGEERIERAIEKLELVVAVDLYRNVTGELADYLLPAADWLEREDVNAVGAGYQTRPYLQHAEAVVPPKAERRPDWWIFARLEQAVGVPSILDSAEPDSWASLNEMLGASGLSMQALKNAPGGVVVLPPPDPNHLFELGIHTADGKIDCCPALFGESIAARRPGRAQGGHSGPCRAARCEH